jgi:hypothetical protein
MFLDLKPELINGILAVMQKSPVAHEIVDPMLKEIVRQCNDAKIQSLIYPPDPPKDGD